MARQSGNNTSFSTPNAGNWLTKLTTSFVTKAKGVFWDSRNYDWDDQFCSWDQADEFEAFSKNTNSWYTKN